MRFLIVDADAQFAKQARFALKSQSLVVEVASTANDALDRAAASPYDAIVLDLQLDGASGLDLLKRLRRTHITAPILALTADRQPEARIEALRFGADDCLVKPIVLAELAARLHALSRRQARKAGDCLEIEDLVLHCARHRVFRSGQAVPLTDREFIALEHLVRAQGKAVPASELLNLLWHETEAPRDNFIAVLMMRLRQKVDGGFPVKLIHTIKGAGYAILPPGK